MRILYLCKWASGDNDDEGAIAYALERLGHYVFPVHEKRRHRTTQQQEALERGEYDLCLFHKHDVVSEIQMLAKRMPCAFWYFDMVRSIRGDLSLLTRSESRIRWMYDVVPLVVAGFCTDGDWVRDMNKLPGSPAYVEDKLIHLMQGADERVTGFGGARPYADGHRQILFTGMKHHGQERANHIDHLQRVWGDRFEVLGSGGPQRRLHGRDLANVFVDRVVIAPNGPSTDRYWSNRVYLTLGFGGFLLHPYCKKLLEHYTHDDLVMYRSLEECDELIDFYLRHPEDRLEMQRKGYNRTMRSNLYRHRCEQLLSIVQERL